MKFGSIQTGQAEGAVLAHTLALPSLTLRKGRRLSAEDVALIQEAGIGSVIAATIGPGDLLEDEAARRLASALLGEGVNARGAATGRVNLHADAPGILMVDRQQIDAFNAVDPAITLATLPEYASVTAGQMVATVKIIPFAVPEGLVIDAASAASKGSVIRVHPFVPRRVGLIQTELPSLKSSVLDKTSRVTQARLDRSGSLAVSEARTRHRSEEVARAILEQAAESELVIVFGASAVCDDDDVIPAAIRAAGGRVERVGMPVDPGNLLVLGWVEDVPVLGAPGCARSPKLNGFDWVLDRLMAGLDVTSRDIGRMGVGGLLTEIPSRPQPREIDRSKEMRIDAVLLAAGQATRMGGPNKLLSRFADVPLVRQLTDELAASGVACVVAVTGHQAERVAAMLDGADVRVVVNPDYQTGMASSLKAGLEALPRDSDAALVCLADMPCLREGHFRMLIEKFKDARGRAVIRASSGGSPGNPVILPKSLFAAVRELKGDRGARALLETSGLAIIDVDIGEAAVTDIDTPQALEAAGGEPAD